MKTAQSGSLLALTIGLMTLSSLCSTYALGGSSSGGGGDGVSQDFMNKVRNLPQVIAARGAVEFPEINLSRFQAMTSDGSYRVEVRSKLFVNGAPKAAISFPELKLTQIDPRVWTAFEMMDDGEFRKNALAFHEVLVLMKVEQNDDYHISNRLLSSSPVNASISSIKSIDSIGQITSTNLRSRSVITVVNYADHTSTFYYCEDRQDARSCVVLGQIGRF